MQHVPSSLSHTKLPTFPLSLSVSLSLSHSYTHSSQSQKKLNPMKHKLTQPCCVIVFLLCLIAVSKTSARPLDTIKSSGVDLNDDQKLHDEVMNRVSLFKSQDNDSADVSFSSTYNMSFILYTQTSLYPL